MRFAYAIAVGLVVSGVSLGAYYASENVHSTGNQGEVEFMLKHLPRSVLK